MTVSLPERRASQSDEVGSPGFEEAVAFVREFLGGDGETDMGIGEERARYLVEQVSEPV